MKIIIEDSVRQSLDDIFYYNLLYSTSNALETDTSILQYIQVLNNSPYIGKKIPEIANDHFRELIYRRTKQSTYRIMYYISKKKNIIYIFDIVNCKQNFHRILKLHNYFKKYYNLWIKPY